MHKPEFDNENEIHKICLDFEIHTEYQIPFKELNLVLTSKEKMVFYGICRSSRLQMFIDGYDRSSRPQTVIYGIWHYLWMRLI